ncbi:hypothetical protein EDD86DRAFT_111479 [Gorgonomyces haynaldii]|nr:hypothetical protein EDD86DRAFT_111479 [Gorgonomyces haynaldii]
MRSQMTTGRVSLPLFSSGNSRLDDTVATANWVTVWHTFPMITRDTSVNPLANDELVYTIKMSKNMLEHLNETDFQDMELDIDGNSGILKAGDKEFPLLVHPEELDMDVYEMDGSLSKLGHVSQKITPQPSVNSQRIKALTEQEERAKGERRALVIEDKSAKKLKFEKQKKPESDKKRKPTPSKPATLFKPEPELRRKIVHFLATGPKDIKQIAQKVKRQEKDIQLEVLKVVMLRQGSNSTDLKSIRVSDQR